MIDESPSSPIDRRRLWFARVRFLASSHPTHALTLSYNDLVSARRVRSDLDDMHAHLDRRLLGRRFNQMVSERRTWIAAIVERPDTNLHLHLVMRVVADRWQTFEGLFPGQRGPFWTMWAPRGTYALTRIYDAAGWVRYAAKTLRMTSEWIDSAEFLPAHIGP